MVAVVDQAIQRHVVKRAAAPASLAGGLIDDLFADGHAGVRAAIDAGEQRLAALVPPGTLLATGNDCLRIVCGDGHQVLDLARENKPDLILMDINLPDISGLEAAELIKAKPDCSTIPIVAFTADTNEADRSKYIDAGCDGYLPKPASAQRLLQIVKDFL